MIFAFLQRQHADLAGKITGMLLEIDNSELLHMLEDPASLQGKVRFRSSFNTQSILVHNLIPLLHSCVGLLQI